MGKRLASFRTQHGLTQEEVARAVGASNGSAVVYWEKGVSVPDGVRRGRLIALLDGKLWPEMRAVLIAGQGLPKRWDDAVRWYRRLSRERAPRAVVGTRLTTILSQIRVISDGIALRQCYCAQDDVRIDSARDQRAPGAVADVPAWRTTDAAYGLRWLEIRYGVGFDLGRSLVHQIPLPLLDAASHDATREN